MDQHSDEGSDSGMGSLDNFHSRFMHNFVGNLETAVRQRGREIEEDPSFDLQQMGLACRPPSPIHYNRNQSNQAMPQTDLVLDELEIITNEIKKKSAYSDKLTTIMLKDLEKTLGRETYRIFSNGCLPDNWLPIVGMNDRNTPFVEILIKSHEADLGPESQLNKFTYDHLAYSWFIIDHLKTASKQQQQKIVAHSPSTSTPSKIARPISKSTGKKDPAKQRTNPSSGIQQTSNLNTSLKRKQPERICKLNTSMKE